LIFAKCKNKATIKTIFETFMKTGLFTCVSIGNPVESVIAKEIIVQSS
jgi:hypothetical protein